MKKISVERDRLIYLLALEKAHDGTGIYPAAVTAKVGGYTERSPWKNGWNACTMELTSRTNIITDWVKAVPDEYCDLFDDLLVRDILNLNVNGGREKNEDGTTTHNLVEVTMWINCNDLFYWGCADGEDIVFSELPDLAQAYKDSPQMGDILWCCRKRKMRPQTPYYKYIPKEEHHLFNAVGPKRTDA